MNAGRPPIGIDLTQVEELASAGNTDAEIARQLGISVSTISRRKRDFDNFAEAIKRGQERAHSVVSNALYREASKGNVTAIVWYEKTRRGFRDQQDVTSNGETIKLYGGVDPDGV